MADGLTIENTDAGGIAEAQGQVPDTAQQLSKTQPARRKAGQLRRKEKTRTAEEIKSKQEAASRVKAGRGGEVEQLNLLEGRCP